MKKNEKIEMNEYFEKKKTKRKKKLKNQNVKNKGKSKRNKGNILQKKREIQK